MIGGAAATDCATFGEAAAATKGTALGTAAAASAKEAGFELGEHNFTFLADLEQPVLPTLVSLSGSSDVSVSFRFFEIGGGVSAPGRVLAYSNKSIQVRKYRSRKQMHMSLLVRTRTSCSSKSVKTALLTSQ